MWLERDQRGHTFQLCCGPHRMAHYVDVAEMNTVEAADRERNGPDRTGRKTQMDLQLSTFSGTNVLRNGSA